MAARIELPDPADTLRYRIQAQKALPQEDIRITLRAAPDLAAVQD